jgi:methyl-accepting chemotaxis protein
VVASEVRSLAGRSAEAAREIKTLIGASVERVEAGNLLVAEAGQTVGEVVAQVHRVADLMGEMSASSGEQTKGISQIGDAVNQLDQVTQQNAALVEESAAAAESLKHQAKALAQAVAVFRLEGDKPATATLSASLAAVPAQRARLDASRLRPSATLAGTAAFIAVQPVAAASNSRNDGDWTAF